MPWTHFYAETVVLKKHPPADEKTVEAVENWSDMVLEMCS